MICLRFRIIFFEENNVDWKYCVGLCTDGAHAISGYFSGLRALVQGIAPRDKWTHCLIHPEALASKQLNSDLNEMLETVVKIVNFIKTRHPNTRIFQRFCDNLRAERNNLLFYYNSRWLPKRKVLFCAYELRSKIIIFLQEEKHSLITTFKDEVFQSKLAYLCDFPDYLKF